MMMVASRGCIVRVRNIADTKTIEMIYVISSGKMYACKLLLHYLHWIVRRDYVRWHMIRPSNKYYGGIVWMSCCRVCLLSVKTL